MRSILDDVIRDRQIFGRQNISCEPGKNPQLILNEIINTNPYKEDYDSVTTAFIYKKVTYEECMDSLKDIYKQKILPTSIINYCD